MAERREGRSAQKREWTVQEILDQMALCVDDDHCAERCTEQPCVLQDTAFLCSIARGLQVQRAEIEAQRRANEGHRVMVAKLREELQRTNEKYVDLRRRTLEEIRNLLEKGTEA